jgi:hypothetical protein
LEKDRRAVTEREEDWGGSVKKKKGKGGETERERQRIVWRETR